MRAVLTGRWARGHRTKSPVSSRLAANSLANKLPKTHSPGDTGKGDRSQLLKFKEMILKYLGPGSLEHTVTSFWEYLLLLEICYKLLEKDRLPHTRDSRLQLPYRKLAAIYDSDRYVTEGGFSARLS